MFLHRIDPLRDPFLNSPWMATGRRVALAALDSVERAVLHLRTALVSVSPPDGERAAPGTSSQTRDPRWLH